MGPVLGPHARTDRTRDTRVAEPRLPAPEDGRPGEGQRLTPDAPHNGGRPAPPGDGPPPPPRHAAPTGHAGQGDSVGPPHPHTRAHSTWVADPNSPPSGRAVGGGTAPDLRRPSQWWKAPPPGTPFRHPHSEQRRPARAHAVGPVLGPHARTDGTRDTRVAEPRLPAPEDGRPGEGQRLTPDAPHNGGRPPPPGTAPHHPRGTQPPQGMQAKGTVLGPHTNTPAPTARGWRTPTARPVGGQSGEGQRLTSDAPHNGGRHAPRGRPSATPTASNAGRKGARCGTGAGSPRPHRPHPGHTGRGTLAARSRGRAAGGGTAPDTRRPSQRWQATPPGDGPPPPPRHAAPTGHAGRGDSVGLPHPHSPAPTARGWRTPTARPVGGQTGEGRRLASDARHNSGRHPPPGTPFRHPHSGQRRPARAHTVGPLLGPHARTDRTRDTRVAEPWLPAPEDVRPGEGQRLTPGAPHNGGRPPPRGWPPTTPAARSPHRACRPRGQCWAPTPTHPRPQHVGGGPQQPAQWAGSRGRDGAWPQTPSTMVEGTPPGDALPPPPQRATPARKGARCGAGNGSPRPHRPHPGHTGRGTLAARSRRRAAGGGTAPDTRRPSQRWQATPPGDGPLRPRGMQPPQGMQAKGTVLGPHTHTPAPTARGWRTRTARPVGGQSGEGQRLTSDAPHNGGRHPPRGRPSATPTASNAGPQGRTLWGRCWVPAPGPTAPGIHGSRNPGCPLQRTGGRGRDSA